MEIKKLIKRLKFEAQIVYKTHKFQHRLYQKNAKMRNVLFFIIDPRFKHPGLADRLKAIVSCYYIAKQNNYDFKIIFDTPFCLEHYLQPAKVKWVGNIDSLEYSKRDTRIYNYIPWHGVPKLKREKQYHCINYVGHSIFPYVKGEKPLWSSLYGELFKPSELLQEAIDSCGWAENSYVAIHLRFVNALGKKEDINMKVLPEEKRKHLITKCKRAITDICSIQSVPAIVFSDSSVFLESLLDTPAFLLNTANISHISYSQGSDDKSILKTFLDFYMMSRAREVYRITAPEMYESDFCVYAARMGNKKFIQYKA